LQCVSIRDRTEVSAKPTMLGGQQMAKRKKAKAKKAAKKTAKKATKKTTKKRKAKK